MSYIRILNMVKDNLFQKTKRNFYGFSGPENQRFSRRLDKNENG